MSDEYQYDDNNKFGETHPRLMSYSLLVDHKYYRKYTDQEKIWLRPIAETLAMINGQALLGQPLTGTDYYEYFLPVAAAVFYSNGGIDGWAGHACWLMDLKHETPAVEEAYNSWKSLKILSK